MKINREYTIYIYWSKSGLLACFDNGNTWLVPLIIRRSLKKKKKKDNPYKLNKAMPLPLALLNTFLLVPLKIDFYSGGILITAVGSNMDSVSEPVMEVTAVSPTGRNQYFQVSLTVNSYMVMPITMLLLFEI